jgi:nucleoside-diphosphate-sugar epimerase
MNILIIGGTGFISSSLVKQLLQSDHKVISLTRGNSKKKLEHPNLIYETGNRNDEHKLKNLLSKYNIDVVYDMIAYLPEESELMVKIFNGKIKRFIHCSTISVYMISDDVKCPVTEDQNKKKVMEYFERNPFGMSYGINKRRCEDVLWKAHDKNYFPVSMLRPTFVCGPYDPSGRDWFWIERILDGNPLLIPGSGNFKFQIVYVDDTAKAFHDLLYNDSSIGEAYNVAGEEIFTLNEYLFQLSKMLNKKPGMVHIDQQEFDKLSFSRYPGADVFPFNTRRDGYFSLEKIKRDLKYKSTPFENWMSRTINWYLSEMKKHSAGYEYRNEEIKTAKFLLQNYKNIN